MTRPLLLRQKRRTASWRAIPPTAVVSALLLLSACGPESAAESTRETFHAAIASCNASTPSTLRSCVSEANAGTIDVINITGLITCSGANACAMNFTSGTRAVTVQGSGTSSGLNRTDNSNYTLIRVARPNITLKAFRLSDPPNVPDYTNPTKLLTATNSACAVKPNSCSPTIDIVKTSVVTVDGLLLQNAKHNAINVSNSSGITIRNSTITGAWMFGVQLVTNATNVTIEGNTFQNIRSNAVVLSGNTIRLKSNTFSDCHRAAAWWAGANSRTASSGGIVFVYNNSVHVTVDGNTIRSSRIAESINPTTARVEYGIHVHGIELDWFSPTSMSDIRLIGNTIHDLSGYGISVPMNYVRNDPNIGLVITGNRFYNLKSSAWSGCPIDAIHLFYSGPRSYPFAHNCYSATGCAPQPPVPAAPTAPVIRRSGLGCAGNNGIWMITAGAGTSGRINTLTSTGSVLNRYQGNNVGPYDVDGRTRSGDAFSFCLRTQAEKNALTGSGLKVCLVSVESFLHTCEQFRK